MDVNNLCQLTNRHMLADQAPSNLAALKCWLSSAGDTGPHTSNQMAATMPFQRWFKFKEAFAPSFVVDTLKQMDSSPTTCLDPFGGSGTTAVTCQFLGVRPTTIEVNPF